MLLKYLIVYKKNKDMLEDKPKEEPKKDNSFKGFAERRAK